MSAGGGAFFAGLAAGCLAAFVWALVFAAVVHATVPAEPVVIERLRDVCWLDYGP